MESLRIELERGRVNEVRLEDGTRIIVEPLSELRIDRRPSAVSVHEARHAVLAMLRGVSVYHLTNIPEGDSAGHTLLSHFDPIVAAGPHAMGSPGGGHDLWQIAASGNSVEDSLAAARSMLRGMETEVLALATALDERRKVNGSEMLSVMRLVEEEKRGETLVLARVISPDGEERKIKKLKTRGGEAFLSAADLPIERGEHRDTSPERFSDQSRTAWSR